MMANKKNPKINWNSGDISGSQISVGNGNVMIQGQGNRVQQTKYTGISRAELKELQSGFTNLNAQIEATAPPEKKDEALQKAKELQEAVLEEKPDPSKIVLVRDWFLKNAPGLAGAVTGMVVNPIVGKLVAAAGDLAAGEFKRLLGDTG
jgi:hypothetical protein